MTQDEIIEMAIQADVWVVGQEPYQSQLERFANLVAQHEREACLKFCDQVAEYFPSSGFVGSYIGQKIRARSKE
jgi:hypothetical protein